MTIATFRMARVSGHFWTWHFVTRATAGFKHPTTCLENTWIGVPQQYIRLNNSQQLSPSTVWIWRFVPSPMGKSDGGWWLAPPSLEILDSRSGDGAFHCCSFLTFVCVEIVSRLKLRLSVGHVHNVWKCWRWQHHLPVLSIRVFHKHTKLPILALLPTLYSHIFAIISFNCTNWS